MKRINIYITFFALVTFTLSSCKLESENFDAIDPLKYPVTARDAKDLTTANAYGVFRSNQYTGVFNAGPGIMVTNDMATDYGFCTWGGNAWEPLEFGRWTPQDARNIKEQWKYMNELSRMTMTIDRISGIKMDENIKKQYIAELRCARGFLGFIFYDFYGPFILADIETIKNPLAEKILPRLSEEEAQNFIVTELTEAAKDLPHSYKKGDSDYGRFTKGLCNMILLKYYMQTRQWDKAIAMGRELQKPEYGYSLVTNKGAEKSAYANIFTAANEKNAETIWAVNCKTGYQTHLWYPHVLPNNINTFKGGWGGYKMTWKFFKLFEEGDTRKETIIYEYTANNGTVYNEANKGTASALQDGVVPLKYKIEPDNVGNQCQTDWIVYRYADAITLLAEAIVRKDNVVTQEAVDLLNMVRTRAGLNAYTLASFSSSRDFLDKLLMERAFEFYFEGCRRQDLIRDGSYIKAMTQKCKDYGQSVQITENHVRFPVPEGIIIEGKGTIKQNPGY